MMEKRHLSCRLLFAMVTIMSTVVSTGAIASMGTSIQREFWVDPVSGDDRNDGSKTSPVQSLVNAADKAASAARLSQSQGVEGAIHVYLLPTGPFTGQHKLNASHSGVEGSPIIFHPPSDNDQGRPLVTLGMQIDASKFACRSSRMQFAQQQLQQLQVCTVNLTSALGLREFGSLRPGGLGGCNTDRAEVFVNGAPLTLARFPNINTSSGYNNWMNIASVENSSTSFSLADPTGEVAKRATAWAKESALFFHGYWSYDWADSYIAAEKFDPASLTVFASPETPPVYGFRKKARVMAVNALSELDVPGEYYIDVESGVLSFIPPEGRLDPTADEIYISTFPEDGCSLSSSSSSGQQCCEGALCLESVSHVSFEGIDFRYSRRSLIHVRGGFNVTMRDVKVMGATKEGAILDGSSVRLIDSRVLNTGCSAVVLAGGDTPSLTGSQNEISGSFLSNFSRWTRTYTPGISWRGVGHWVHNNTITDAPHSAVQGGGNDLLFEHNFVARCGFEVDDSGAFYTGRNWAHRGNVIRFNTFSSIRTRVPVFLGVPSVQGVYLDDEMSGFQVYNNSFHDCQTGIVMGGGRHNHVKFNSFSDCDLAIHFDSRGVSSFDKDCYPNCPIWTGKMAPTLWHSVGGSDDDLLHPGSFVTTNPWAVRYPELANIGVDGRLGYPVYNVIVGNSYCRCESFISANVTQITDEWRGVVDANVEGCE